MTEDQSFGGKWTEEKLETFVKYVKAYLTILNKYKSKYNWKTIYFDGFAGSGNRIKKIVDMDTPEFSIFEEFEEEAIPDIQVYTGSVHRVLELEEPFRFDRYYFIDTNPSHIEKIKEIRSELGYTSEQVIARQGDCNEEMVKLADALKEIHHNRGKKYTALIFLDPFGMQVNWESIEKLKETKSDLWILLPSGVAVNRLLPRDGEIRNPETLERFFGLPIKEIEEHFYPKPVQQSLFGLESEKTQQPFEAIVNLYRERLLTVWDHVIPEPLVLKNTVNVPIYHLLFASNNKTGLKIARDIIKKEQT